MSNCSLCPRPQEGFIWNYVPGNGFYNADTGTLYTMESVGLVPVCRHHLMAIGSEKPGFYTAVPYGCSN